MLFVEVIVIGAISAITLALGDLPYKDPYAWGMVWLIFYYNHIRAAIAGMRNPQHGDGPWYCWFYDTFHDIFHIRSRKQQDEAYERILTDIDTLNKISSRYYDKTNGKT
jgi:hypothetical protein